MPLSDNEAKRAYDSTLQPEEEQRKWWTANYTVTLDFSIRKYGTEQTVRNTIKNIATGIAFDLSAEDYNVEITDITEQEGE